MTDRKTEATTQILMTTSLKPWHAVAVFLLMLVPSAVSSWVSYEHTRTAVLHDMDQALEKTLASQRSLTITPDTVRNYQKHLQIAQLRDSSHVYYAQSRHPHWLCSRRMVMTSGSRSCAYQCYASCSPLTLLAMSDQRLPSWLLTMAAVWAVGAACLLRRQRQLTQNDIVVGRISYDTSTDTFYDNRRRAIHLTPMQGQLLSMFFTADGHRLSKQHICDSLWPKKPDATETLYTLIRRLRPFVGEQGGLEISSDRGGDYTLSRKN
jgi:hypothetical protein